MYINSLKLAKYFGGYNLPDAFVIVGTKSGKYVYIDDDGNNTVDRSKAKIIGLNAENENRFEKIIDRALIQQDNNKYMLTGQHKNRKPSANNKTVKTNRVNNTENGQYTGGENQGRQFPGGLFR